MTNVHALIEATIQAHVAPGAKVVEVRQRAGGEQGYSGAVVGYYDVTYTRGDTHDSITLVTKDAPLVERHVLSWLGCQGLAVPFNQTFDLTTDALAPVCMQFVGDTPPPSERARQAARALAAIHATTRGRHAELPWLPRADASFAAQWIVETCWREPWQRVLAGKEYVDAYGNHWGPAKPGGDFRAEFGAYTQPLEAAAGRFVQAMAELWDEGDSLTLIHADFHSAHVRTYDSREYVIDWGFAHYGSFYVDLPNYFSREEALVYRDELAKLGHDIPRDTFLARYDAISPYPGFKYFGLGLWNWCYGDPPHQREHVVHFVDMVLKSPK